MLFGFPPVEKEGIMQRLIKKNTACDYGDHNDNW